MLVQMIFSVSYDSNLHILSWKNYNSKNEILGHVITKYDNNTLGEKAIENLFFENPNFSY